MGMVSRWASCQARFEDARLTLVARDSDKLRWAEQLLAAEDRDGAGVETCSCDVSDYPGVEEAFRGIIDRSGSVDILICSAGIILEGYFQEQPVARRQRVVGR